MIVMCFIVTRAPPKKGTEENKNARTKGYASPHTGIYKAIIPSLVKYKTCTLYLLLPYPVHLTPVILSIRGRSVQYSL
jgi:hypothetical protein